MKLIDVSTKKFPNTFAMVDDEDFDRLNQWEWFAMKGVYTLYARRKSSPRVLMHCMLLDAPPGMERDHRDGNGLNNQKSNLRKCTRSQNQCNARKHRNGRTSVFAGVSFDKGSSLYRARITIEKEVIYVGRFKTQEEAARARDLAAKRHHGKFARLNNA
jgi:hypothetical protein